MSQEIQKEREEVIKLFSDLALFLENTITDSQSLDGPDLKTLVGNVLKTIRFLDQQTNSFKLRKDKREEEHALEKEEDTTLEALDLELDEEDSAKPAKKKLEK